MSRIAYTPPTPVDATKRRAMTAARKRRIWRAHNGRCKCGAAVPVSGPGVNYDHWSPINFGSPDDDDHVWPLCDPCNAEKLKKDLADIGHVRRLIKGPTASKHPIQSRGFQKGLSRGFDGSVKPRDAGRCRYLNLLVDAIPGFALCRRC